MTGKCQLELFGGSQHLSSPLYGTVGAVTITFDEYSSSSRCRLHICYQSVVDLLHGDSQYIHMQCAQESQSKALTQGGRGLTGN